MELDLNSLLEEYVKWSSGYFTFSGYTKAHITLARISYLQSLKNKIKDIEIYGLIWDIALWYHENNYFKHPKETFFRILKDSGCDLITEQDTVPFQMFDQKLIETDELESLVSKTFDEIGYFPVMENSYRLILNDLITKDKDGKKEIYWHKGSSRT